MGLDNASTKFICAAKSLGANFSKTLMIGRQSLVLEKSVLQKVFSVHGIDGDAAKFLRENEYADNFFSLFGAREINSLDYFSHEDATILHDMNAPIQEDLRERFSVVYDGGTLEHVFNIPQALKNCMEMVEVGGHFIQGNIANNFMGHGFWQFSPELLFRVFSQENGFEIEAVLLHEVVPGGSWYSVSDPDLVRRRVVLCNSTPTYIFTIAKRVSNVQVFAKPPMQSDYSALWDQVAKERSNSFSAASSGNTSSRTSSLRSHLISYLPEPVKRVLKAARRKFSLLRPFKQSYYQSVSEDDLLRGVL